MKTTKKLLSLVLAIIMVMAVSPMALAYNFDTNAFKEMVVGFADYIHNIYEPVGDMSSDDIRSRIMDAYTDAFIGVSGENTDFDLSWLEENPDKAELVFEEINAVTANIEKSIAEGKLVVRVDASNFYSYYMIVSLLYEDEYSKLFSEDSAFEKAFASFEAAMDLLNESDPDEVTQEMFDEAAADFRSYAVSCIACIEGKHELDYIVNEDGTHYSYCDFCKTENVEEHTFEDGRCVCGAEEPVIEDNTDTGASVSFIQRIIDFFRSLFDKILSLFK